MAKQTVREMLLNTGTRAITVGGMAVCVCGQLFLKADAYVEHVMQCEHAQRGEDVRPVSERPKAFESE